MDNSEIETYDSPMWTLKTTEYNGIKIKPLLVILPNNNKLLQIEKKQVCYQAIVKQIIDIIFTLNGKITSGVIIREDIINKYNKGLFADEDIILLCFIKHYYGTTSTSIIPLTKKGFDKNTIFSDVKLTNKIIKNAECNSFIDMKMLISTNELRFGIYKDNDLHLEQLTDAKKKLLID